MKFLPRQAGFISVVLTSYLFCCCNKNSNTKHFKRVRNYFSLSLQGEIVHHGREAGGQLVPLHQQPGSRELRGSDAQS